MAAVFTQLGLGVRDRALRSGGPSVKKGDRLLGPFPLVPGSCSGLWASCLFPRLLCSIRKQKLDHNSAVHLRVERACGKPSLLTVLPLMDTHCRPVLCGVLYKCDLVQC